MHIRGSLWIEPWLQIVTNIGPSCRGWCEAVATRTLARVSRPHSARPGRGTVFNSHRLSLRGVCSYLYA